MTGPSLLDQAMTLRKVRRTKNILLGVIAIGMVIVLLISLNHKGVSTSPLFLPVPAIILVLMMGAMLMNFTSIAFNATEMFTADTPGQKFRSASHGFKVSLWTGGLCLVLVIFFVVAMPWVETQISTYRDEALTPGTIKEHEWFTIDDFDLSYAFELSLDVVDGAPMEYTVRAKDPDTGRYSDKLSGRVTEGEPLVIDLTEWPKGEYMTVFWTDGSAGESASSYIYRVDRVINSELKVALTGILGVIAISGILWGVVTYVLKQRFEVESVGGLATHLSDPGY